MENAPRSRSPRAPSFALDDAIAKAIKIYEKERRHAAPSEVVAQDMGYKNANSGSALSALASLRYYGLLDRVQEGKYAVSKEVEDFQFAPSEALRQSHISGWLRRPAVFSDLLEQYSSGLPSDATLRFTLIQKGFTPEAASAVLSIFKRSVEFARVFEGESAPPAVSSDDSEVDEKEATAEQGRQPILEEEASVKAAPSQVSDPVNDRIPVRLSGGRRAWLEIPSPFFAADKKRLKAQIDLLLTEDEDEN